MSSARDAVDAAIGLGRHFKHTCHLEPPSPFAHTLVCPTGEHMGGWQHPPGPHKMCDDCGPYSMSHVAAMLDELEADAFRRGHNAGREYEREVMNEDTPPSESELSPWEQLKDAVRRMWNT